MAATYDITKTIPSVIRTGDILNCPYSGEAISITLPKGKYLLEVWGAQGGYRSSSTYGGKGGYAKGVLELLEETLVYLLSGGSGNSQTASGSSSVLTPGGFNGGGQRDRYRGGGGASDIRIGQNSLYARVAVAGGGGSDGATSKQGMYGGGTSGGTATQSYGTGGGGGTQTAGGAGGSSNSGTFGQGGLGHYRSSGYGGAGGGGWYGGGGVYPDSSGDDDRGGGGGSGYVYTESTASNYPSGCLLDSRYYLTETSLIAGNQSFTDPDGSTVTGHAGDGYSRITVIEAESLKPPTNLEYEVINKNVHLSWDAPIEGSEPEGYKIYQNGDLVGTTSSLTFSKLISPDQTYTFTIRSYSGSEESDPASISVSYQLPEPPTNPTCSVENGSAILSWDESVSDVEGYRIYKDGVLIGSTPQILPMFEFPFSNESLTEPLLMFANGETTEFSYPVQPLTNYTFGIVSVAKEGESEMVNISLYYETHLQITAISLIPNPVLTGSPLTVSALVKEVIDLTIE